MHIGSGAATEALSPLSRQAYEEIRAQIAEGQLPPSEPVREIDIVRKLSMSRTPIREALQRLATEGFIRRVPGGYVALELGPKGLTDIYQVRAALTALAARLAAEHRSRVHIARMQDALDAISQPPVPGDDDEREARVREYWHVLAEASGNDYLSSTLANVVDLFRYKALVITHPEWREALLAEMRELLEHVIAQDAPAAERTAHAVIANSLVRRISSMRKERERAS